MEKTTQDISRLLAEKDFDSMEEANAFIEETLQGGGLPQASAPVTALGKAQELVYQAFETESHRKRVQLAKRALKTSGDCADAYVLLAEETAEDLEEARELYERGVEAGERALGEGAFEQDAGHFWGILQTRPYMRAREGLALCLWALGEREAALEHYIEMLRLNPHDNQGIRYVLADCLLEEEMDEPLGELLAQYEDEASAMWVYTRALWRFRKEGATQEADAALREALQTNPYVPPYLLGQKSLPGALPELVGLGDESEAVSYFARALTGWLKTPGAIEWLRESAGAGATGTGATGAGAAGAGSIGEGAEVIPLPGREPAGANTSFSSDDFGSDEEEEAFLAALDAEEGAAVELLRRALPELRAAEPPPEELAVAAKRVRTGLSRGEWPFDHMLGATAWDPENLPKSDIELWLGAVGAPVSPREEMGLGSEEEAAIMALELADWLGATIGLVRAGVGASASPETLISYIDRCPEVDGIFDPEDSGVAGMAFELVLPAWEAAGALDEHRRLTALGMWGLPRALSWAWGGDFEAGEAG